VAVALVVVVSAELQQQEEVREVDRATQHAFVAFVTSFGKHYQDTTEFFARLQIFSANLDVIHAHNDQKLSWTMGVGPFADLTHEEFMESFATGLVVPDVQEPLGEVVNFTGNGAFDWVKAGKVTGIKNQGQCGSCWAFATSAGVESFAAIHGHPLMDLSPQLLVDCARTEKCHGCQGGWMMDALAWIHGNGGHCDWQSYPYVGHEQQCHGCQKKVSIGGGSAFSGEGAIEQHGGSTPVIVGLDVSNWQHYAGGLYTGGCGGQPQHAVVVVGAGRMSNQPAWQIKNSWGQGWGAQGYIFMAAGHNLCGIGNWPCVPV